MIWQESSGPPVKPPNRKGFGSFVMEEMMKRGMDATVKIDFAPNGVVWTLDIPSAYAVRTE